MNNFIARNYQNRIGCHGEKKKKSCSKDNFWFPRSTMKRERQRGKRKKRGEALTEYAIVTLSAKMRRREENERPI